MGRPRTLRPQLRRGSLGGSDLGMPSLAYRLACSAGAAIALACAAGFEALPPAPAPCVANDTIYTRADVARGVQPPSPKEIVTPPAELRGHVIELRLLIDPFGHVVEDSVQVSGLTDQRDQRLMRRTAARFIYRPAVLGGCAVRFRDSLKISS